MTWQRIDDNTPTNRALMVGHYCTTVAGRAWYEAEARWHNGYWIGVHTATRIDATHWTEVPKTPKPPKDEE